MLYFLSGLPRSGSTLLGALLSQRDDTFVSATSGLIEIMGATAMTWERSPTTKVQHSSNEEVIRILKSIAEAKYSDKKQPIIIDKNRGWPDSKIMSTMKKVLGKSPKIIATVRPVAECLASFVKLTNPKNVKDFCKNDQLILHLFSSYDTLKLGWMSNPENFLFVEYDNLVTNPQRELDRVADFLGIKRFKHFFENIENPLKERDEEAWNVKGLHDIRPNVKKEEYDAKKLLGEDLWEKYQGGDFWLNKKEPKKEKTLLDLQLEAGLKGDFETGWKIAQQLEKERPNDDRAAYNRGWYLLRQGKLQEGIKLLDRGRNEDVFGNPHIGTAQPIWNGDTDKYVLLNLEGNLGDQIHGARWVKYIVARGNKVVLSCSAEIMPLISEIEGVSSVVQREAALGAYHDSWIPSMSAVMPLGYEYIDIDGSPYIKKYGAKKNSGKKVIGLYWEGNNDSQNSQDFPKEKLFEYLKEVDAEFISLRKINGETVPSWIKKTEFGNWIELAKVISSCDIVISPDSAVAHLASAMGVKTFIILPILPYYLWALSGEKTPYYNNTVLFRQEKPGSWEEPIKSIRERLKKDEVLENKLNAETIQQ